MAFQLNPKLWQNLPDDLVDAIVEKVLIGLPFSSVQAFCFLSNRSRTFLLSTEYVLYFNKPDACAIFNPRTGLWESIPLRLSQTQALTLQHMELVCCDEGLLYFSNAARNEYILYNPLYPSCSKLLTRQNARIQSIIIANRKVNKSYPTGLFVMRRASPGSVFGPGITLPIVAYSDTGFVELHMGKEFRNGMPLEGLMLKDSRDGLWRRLANVERGFHFLAFPTTFPAGENSTFAREIPLGFERPDLSTFHVLLYQVSERRCRSVRNVRDLSKLADVGKQRTLFATVTEGGELEFLRIVEGGQMLVKADFPPPPLVLRTNATFGFVLLQGEGIMYYLWLFRHQPEGQARWGQVNISVRMQNLLNGEVNGIERILNWTECPFAGSWEPYELPTSINFHIFRPRMFPLLSSL